jgi:hypothetical protein
MWGIISTKNGLKRVGKVFDKRIPILKNPGFLVAF